MTNDSEKLGCILKLGDCHQSIHSNLYHIYGYFRYGTCHVWRSHRKDPQHSFSLGVFAATNGAVGQFLPLLIEKHLE